MKHKHSEVIKAFADGIECEYWFSADRWIQINEIAVFDWAHTVRIKPEAQKEQEPQYLYVYRHIDTSKTKMCTTLMQDTSDWDYLGKVRVEK